LLWANETKRHSYRIKRKARERRKRVCFFKKLLLFYYCREIMRNFIILWFSLEKSLKAITWNLKIQFRICSFTRMFCQITGRWARTRNIIWTLVEERLEWWQRNLGLSNMSVFLGIIAMIIYEGQKWFSDRWCYAVDTCQLLFNTY
jgi:hypothetical protein